MPRFIARMISALACAFLFSALAAPAFAQMGPKVRFANWEFELPPMLSKAQETREQLVLKLDPAMSGGAGATVTLRAGEPLKGDLTARLDAEWKQLVRNRKLTGIDPPGSSSLADGTEGLRRSARLPGNGTLTLDAYRTPGGVNFMIVDATNETAAQMIDGATAMLTMTAKLQPLTTVASAGTPKPAPGTPATTTTSEPASAAVTRQSAAGTGMMQPPSFLAGQPAAQKKTDRDVEKIEVPRKDTARIKAVPSRAPSDKVLQDFLRKIEAPVRQKLSKNAQSAADNLYKDARKRSLSADAIGNMAVGLWMMGNFEPALALMGKAVLDEPSNVSNLNNYAALLNMAGGEHLALPILMKLDQDFPGNSTVLNNIAQAWFGLGDIDKASEILSKALLRFPAHSQANLTKAVIAGHKGNKQGAVEAMRKSMAQGYSEDKEAQLEQLGDKVSGANINWDVPRKPEPLKLHKFLQLIPPYYKSTADAPRAMAEWGAFRESVRGALQALETQEAAIQPQVQQEWRKFAADSMAGKKRISPLQIKYTLKYVTYGKLPETLTEQAMRWNKDEEIVSRQVDQLAQAAQTTLKNPNLDCAARDKAATNFMSQANTLWENHQREAKLKEKIRWHEEWANLFLYYNTPGDVTYQSYLLALKRQYLTMLLQLNHVTMSGCTSPVAKPGRRGPLPHFEDLHCEKKINFTVPMIGSIHVNCHYISANFNIAGAISGTIKEDLNTGEFVRGTVEVGLTSKQGSKDISGPIKAEAGVEATGFVEFDKNGMSDIGVKAGATAEVKLDGMPGASAGAGVTTRIGLNSGVGVQGSGVLSGVSSQTTW